MSASRTLAGRAWRIFLSGLAAVIPLAVTVWLVWWVFTSAEALFGALFRRLLPEGWYLPGAGIVTAVVAVFALGLILRAWVFSRLLKLATGLVERVPLIRTVYSGVRDLMDFVSRESADDGRQVVLVTLPGGIRLVGFVTDAAPAEVLPQLATGDGEAVLAVYLPMGYQVGGYTLYLPASRCTPLDMPVDDAMRMVLTAGINRPGVRAADAAA